MELTTKEWIKHLKEYVENHVRINAVDKSYILVILDKTEKSMMEK